LVIVSLRSACTVGSDLCRECTEMRISKADPPLV
jgi:hypothetical protein